MRLWPPNPAFGFAMAKGGAPPTLDRRIAGERQPQSSGRIDGAKREQEWIHTGLNSTLCPSFILHVRTALMHHFICRDAALSRMLPNAGMKGNAG
jgi:cytochrome b561